MVPLPNGKRLASDDVLTILLNARPHLPTSIPHGRKENAYVLIDNRRNQQLKDNGKSLQFADDRGVWDSYKNSMPRVPYVREAGGNWRRVFVKDGKYCRERNLSRGDYVYCELNPQPSDEDVVVLRHYYTTLRSSSDYKRRISWIDGEMGTAALVEYTGSFPGHTSHGNCSSSYRTYRRADPGVLDAVANWTGIQPPKVVYSDLVAQGMQPRDVKQVRLSSDHNAFLEREWLQSQVFMSHY
jgi:hypothetical protein